MSENNKQDNEEYQFLREKIVSKKKNKIKRWSLTIIGVLLLAVVFGIVARVTFIASDDIIRNIMGVSATPTPTKVPIVIPSIITKPSPTPIPTPIPTPTPTDAVSPTPEDVTAAPTATPTPEVTEEPMTVTPELSEVDGVLEFFEKISKVANKAAEYLVEVEMVNITTDWFGEDLETSKTTCGIMLGNNGVELLALVSAARVEKADRIDISIADKHINDVKVIAENQEFDLAIIAVPLSEIPEETRENLTYAVFGESEKLNPGAPVIVIGNPNGYFGAFEIAMVTTSKDYAYVTDSRLELFNTSMRENLDGDGVIINLNGEIVGLGTHTFKEDKNASLLTFVGIDHIKGMLASLANGSVRNYFGVVVKEAPASVLEKLNLKNGLYVTEVKEGSPAELAGIKKGCIITGLNDKTMNTVDDFSLELNSVSAGSVLKADVVFSDKTTKKLDVTLEKTESK